MQSSSVLPRFLQMAFHVAAVQKLPSIHQVQMLEHGCTTTFAAKFT